MVLKDNGAIPTQRKQVWDFLTDLSPIGQRVMGVAKLEVIELLKKYRGAVSVGQC